MTPKVSVVVTSYATPTRLLAISLTSVLEQSIEDLELVLVADGELAPENQEVVDELARADDRLVVVNPGRVGRAKALNLGLDVARAPLVAIQDADDASHPQRLEIQTRLMTKTPKLSVLGAASAKALKLPASMICFAARMNPPHAERASDPPTLMRRTPSSAQSLTVSALGVPISRLTGFGATACTTAAICSRVEMPGA